jgi:hypothetical protein
MESYLQPCECGGRFKKGAAPPHCNHALSAKVATAYIEANASGAKKGWKWQRNWSDVYCIVIENKRVANNFEQPAS